MSRFHSYINTTKELVASYLGAEPFSSFIKKYFSANKKYGSRDRKSIAHLCYCFFRLGKSFEKLNAEERILLGLFLCSSATNEILQQLKPEWNENVELQLEEKLKLLNIQFKYKQVFPLAHELSDGIEVEKFCLSHLVQPDLFLRVRPGMKETVLNKIKNAAIDFELKGDACIALSNSTKIDEVLLMNKEVVVQDWNSQRVGELIANLKSEIINKKISVWDCCAASGGKSIMARDILGEINLTVSDVRESILYNLKKRFAEAGIAKYKSFVADLSKENHSAPFETYQLIIADVPCSGSGTWGRTPEQLHFFEHASIEQYAQLQKKIAGAVVNQLEQNGFLIYITCSVYKKENEEVVAILQNVHSLQLIEQRILKGYDEKADTMFVALLQKS